MNTDERTKVKILKDSLQNSTLNYAKDALDYINILENLLAKHNVMDRLPESDEIRHQAQQMDEKEFDKWWWETVYKGN